MKHRKIYSIFILFFILLVFIFVFFGIRKRTRKDSFSEFKADGLGMVHTTYDRENKKSIEIECTESNNESSDKILMKDIKATVFKKGKMKEDFHVALLGVFEYAGRQGTEGHSVPRKGKHQGRGV